MTSLPIPDRPVAQQPKANVALDEGLLIDVEKLPALLLPGFQGWSQKYLCRYEIL